MWTEISIGAAFLLGSIAFMVYFSVVSMAKVPEPQRRPELAAQINASLAPDSAFFLRSQGFEFAEAYGFHQVSFGIWMQKGGRSPIHYYCRSETSGGGSTEEFVTVFSDQASLTTTKTRSAFVFPRPFGAFIQAFPGATIMSLWDSHQRGEQFLVTEITVPLGESRLTFTEQLKHGVMMQMAYIRGLPLWPLRGVYWFLIKRYLMHNRPIWEQNITRTYGKIPDRME